MNEKPKFMTHDRIMAGEEYVSYSDYLMLQRERDEARKELEEYRSIAEKIGAVKAVSEKEKAIRERDEARNSLSACMYAMPFGNIQTHTLENLPARIGDLASALAAETEENECLERALAEAREALEYIAHAGLSARHTEDYAKDFLRRKEAAK